MSRVLFVLRFRESSWEKPGGSYSGYGEYECNGSYGGDGSLPGGSGKGMSSGLLNSATFVCDMLNSFGDGIEAKLVQVANNNEIYKEINKFSPSHVIIEALFVVPSKFAELIPLYPHIKWIVRNHSELSFLQSEGIACQWIFQYLAYEQMAVSSNSPRADEELKFLASTIFPSWDEKRLHEKLPYLPNYYPIDRTYQGPKQIDPNKEWISIGCFGAIRPLKNHLEQAVAAIKFAVQHGYKLRFHINATRIEGRGDAILKNLRKLFEHLDPNAFLLVEHGWMDHECFLKLCSTIDLLLQVSFSETFNIVGSDCVSVGVPVVGSKEIPWLPKQFHADPTSSTDIARVMAHAWHVWTSEDPARELTAKYLSEYSAQTQAIWYDHFA